MSTTTTQSGVSQSDPSGGADYDAYAIQVRDLVKDFRVYHRTYANLKGQLTAWVRSALLRQTVSSYAVRRVIDHVSFTIGHGESVALLGHNGSGKSTLLSILSRVYLPTAGSATMHGSMMSLLELGSGFHHELTGIENVYFTGSMRGLTEAEVARRYRSIVDFAEIEDEIMDLPLRMYSSGMQMRLAFAVSVHMDAEILLIDEGLAVGDEWFQEKCFKKIESFKAEGKTLIIVSHELDHVERIADRVLWLDHGRIRGDGPMAPMLAEYRRAMQEHRAS